MNEAGYESGNADVTSGRVLPWLQDTDLVGAWALWEVAYRDLVVLDAANRVVLVYNLTEHNLGDGANYAELKALLVDAASP